MGYLTQAEFENSIPTSELLRFFDDDDDGVIDSAVMTQFLAEVESFLNLYLAPRYTIETLETDSPNSLRFIAIRVARRLMYDRRTGFPVPDGVKDSFTMAKDALKDVREGKLRADRNGDPESPTPLGTSIHPSNAYETTPSYTWKDRLPYSSFLTTWLSLS